MITQPNFTVVIIIIGKTFNASWVFHVGQVRPCEIGVALNVLTRQSSTTPFLLIVKDGRDSPGRHRGACSRRRSPNWRWGWRRSGWAGGRPGPGPGGACTSRRRAAPRPLSAPPAATWGPRPATGRAYPPPYRSRRSNAPRSAFRHPSEETRALEVPISHLQRVLFFMDLIFFSSTFDDVLAIILFYSPDQRFSTFSTQRRTNKLATALHTVNWRKVYAHLLNNTLLIY